MTVLVILKIIFNFCERIFATKWGKIQAGLNVLGDTNAIININAISKFNI